MTEREMNNELIKRLSSSSALMSMLPEYPDCNGTAFVINDVKAERIVKDINDAVAALTQQQEAEPFGYLIYDDFHKTEDFTRVKPEHVNREHEQIAAVFLNPPKPAALPGNDATLKLSELMRGLEIPPASAVNKPAFFYAVGKAIANQAKAAQPQVPEGCPPDIEVREAVADFMRDTQTLPLDHCARRLVIKIKQMLSAAKEEGK